MTLYLECRAFSGDAPAPGTSSFSNTGGSLASASSYALNSPTSPEQRLLLQQQGVSGLRMSKLTFVDMAGADRLEISGAVGDTLVESQNINLSLHAFGMSGSTLVQYFTRIYLSMHITCFQAMSCLRCPRTRKLIRAVVRRLPRTSPS